MTTPGEETKKAAVMDGNNSLYICPLGTRNGLIKTNTMKTVIVLDFSDGSVNIYKYDPKVIDINYDGDLEDWIRVQGHSSDIMYMAVDNLNLTIHHES